MPGVSCSLKHVLPSSQLVVSICEHVSGGRQGKENGAARGREQHGKGGKWHGRGRETAQQGREMVQHDERKTAWWEGCEWHSRGRENGVAMRWGMVWHVSSF